MGRYFAAICIFSMLLLASCDAGLTGDQVESSELAGRILIWHSWEGEDRAVLQEVLGGFHDLHPDVTIVEESYPLETLQETYHTHAETGFGPDILIAPSSWVNPLIAAKSIRELSEYDLDLTIYLSAAMDMLRSGDDIYGLPLSLNTFALYYNKALLGSQQEPDVSFDSVTAMIQEKQSTITDTQTVGALNDLLVNIEQSQTETEASTPATDLDMLVQQANQGHSVAIRSDFYGSFWGVKAFGGQLFDEEGRVVLNQGSFANWLGWLKNAQEIPYFFLNRNTDELQSLFTSGGATYYIGSSQELSALTEAMGADALGVVRLPGRQNGPTGPFLQAEVLMFSHASTARNTRLALRIAQFLTNAEQQRKLALSAGKLPANNRVNIDRRIAPVVAEFIAQSKTAEAVRLEDTAKFNDVIALGDDMLGQVLGGELAAGDAATALTLDVNEKYNIDSLEVTQTIACDLRGRITFWNTWIDDRRDVIDQIRVNFNELCPNATVVMEDIDPVNFNERYAEALETDQAPAMFLGNQVHLVQFGPKEQILNLNEMLDADFTQRFIPLVDQAIRYNDSVYGIPISLQLMALYYNTALVQDPPIVLNDLLAAASPEGLVAIPLGFEESYWGIAAFGESGVAPQLFNEEKRFILGESGMADWLNWLKEVQSQPGIQLSADRNELRTLFLEEKAIFLAEDSRHLGDLQAALGADKVGVLPLPSGSPLLNVNAFYITPPTPPEDQQLALTFARFATEVESQQLLMAQAQMPPVNINVPLADSPAIAGFVEQAEKAVVVPNVPEVEAVFEWGDLVYEQVLALDIDSAQALQEFTNVVDTTNGFEIVVADASTEEVCDEEGQVSFWSEWSAIETQAWQSVIAKFEEKCPEIQIQTHIVTEDTFTEQLLATLEADSEESPPDLFLMTHRHLSSLRDEELIQDITALVDQDLLLGYLPQILGDVTLNDAVFGLPQALHLSALYYHTDKVETPVHTFEDLLLEASAGLTVAMPSGFYDLLWGAAAFGCQPCQTGAFFDEQGDLILTEADLAEWVNWLESAAETGHFVFSSDPETLESLFLDGQLAYLVTGPDFLNEAQEALGVAHVKVAPLPLGGEELAPISFREIDTFFFFQGASDEQTRLALKFAEFATSTDSQRTLMDEAHYVPTNNLVLVAADDPSLTPFTGAIDLSIPLPTQTQATVLEESSLYQIFDDLGD